MKGEAEREGAEEEADDRALAGSDQGIKKGYFIEFVVLLKYPRIQLN